jgi:uncharacterized protein (DUF4415 family)
MKKRLSDEEFLAKKFDFSKARRVTPEEHARFKEALSKPPKIIGRPRKPPEEKFVPIYIKLDPRIVRWAKREAKRRHLGYQTLLNQELLRLAVA